MTDQVIATANVHMNEYELKVIKHAENLYSFYLNDEVQYQEVTADKAIKELMMYLDT